MTIKYIVPANSEALGFWKKARMAMDFLGRIPDACEYETVWYEFSEAQKQNFRDMGFDWNDATTVTSTAWYIGELYSFYQIIMVVDFRKVVEFGFNFVNDMDAIQFKLSL